MPPQPPRLPIEDDEWDFREVQPDRLGEACVYEYCRSEDWVKEAVLNCSPQVVNGAHRQLPFDRDYVFKRRIDLNRLRERWHLSGFSNSEKQSSAGGVLPSASAKSLRTVFEIGARREPRPGPYNPFLHHDRILTLGMGFPNLPYLRNPNSFALVEVHEGIALPGVYDLKSSEVWAKLKPDSPVWLHADAGSSRKLQWIVSEPNGRPIELSRNDPFRKFALAIDFTRTDEELKDSFGRFLKEARKTYGLSPLKSGRLTRGTVPAWMTPKFCAVALAALGAHRLIRAFEGKSGKAFRHRIGRLEAISPHLQAPHYRQIPEFLRVAKKYPRFERKLFGSV